MNLTAKLGVAGLAGFAIAGGLFYLVQERHRFTSVTCYDVVPSSESTVYGVYLTSGSGQLAMAYIHFYPPGGFKHNIAITVDPSSIGPDNPPAEFNMSNCSSAPVMTMTNDGGTALSTWTFSNPTSGSASFSVKVAPNGSSGVPLQSMTGDVYLMN